MRILIGKQIWKEVLIDTGERMNQRTASRKRKGRFLGFLLAL